MLSQLILLSTARSRWNQSHLLLNERCHTLSMRNACDQMSKYAKSVRNKIFSYLREKQQATGLCFKVTDCIRLCRLRFN